jgi:2-keto-4-pentenoate hydratase/2-oxohepta-3-ene-1,7-dioic acid hydratase in catechol pathway
VNVNGEIAKDDDTAAMIKLLWQLIAPAGASMTLAIGDASRDGRAVEPGE